MSSEQGAGSQSLAAAEWQKIVVDWNATRKVFDRAGAIHELFAAQAARTPHALAAEHAGDRLTYRELNEKAGRFAVRLRAAGVGPETIVGIGLERSLDFAVALLGILKAGGVCMPLDPAYPPERLAYMLEDSGAGVLITHPGFEDRYKVGECVQVVHVGSEPASASPGAADDDRKTRPSEPDAAAWIVYTSGSTGHPRGVVLTHAGLVNHHLAAIELYGITPADRVLQFSPLSFDIAIEEMFPAWLGGATVVFRDTDLPLAPSDFMKWVERKQISVLDLPTAYWHELARGLADKKHPLPDVLRLVIVGGEKASADALRKWSVICGTRVRWINTYGPSEATVIATAWEPHLTDLEVGGDLPIGRPIANTRVYLLDSGLAPVPVGVPGELYIGGAGVARGYFRRPAQTAAKFIQDPFSTEPGAVLYKTGDMACYRPDGNLEFRGREDFQVKIRGFRVEPGEVEAALETHPGVRECAAIVVGEGDKFLAAWIVPAAGECPTARELRGFLAQKLPEHMIPPIFHAVPRLPLTPNGKIDRRALAQMENRIPLEREEAAPADAVEARVVEIIERVLNVRPVGIHEGFFELGGNSLLAIRMMDQIDEAFKRTFPLATLLQASTPAQIAAILRDPKQTVSESCLISVQPQGKQPPFFLVHGMGGHVLRFRALVRHFAPHQPVYALQAQGLSGEAPCLGRVEDMAARYLEEIRAAQPIGPYSLGGYSFGGFVALEIARRLIELGEEVPYLALIDTFAGKPATKASLIKSLLRLPLREQISYLLSKIRKKIRRTASGVRLPAAVKAVRQACAEAEHVYRPSLFEGRITLFLPSSRSLRNSPSPDGGWGKFADKGVTVHEIPGDHGSIVDEPSAAELARLIIAGIELARVPRMQEQEFRARIEEQVAR